MAGQISEVVIGDDGTQWGRVFKDDFDGYSSSNRWRDGSLSFFYQGVEVNFF